MKTLVIYDSKHGNTAKIAKAIAAALACPVQVAGEVNTATLPDYDLLVVGSPTHGGFMSEGMDALLKALPPLPGVNVAVFDTRTQRTMFGYAAPKIARRLQKSGATPVAEPEGFLVLGIKGPLQHNEVEWATEWAQALVTTDIKEQHNV